MKTSDCRPVACPISGLTAARRVFVYDAPPPGEIGFRRPVGAPYYREIWQFDLSNHYVSCHQMDVATGYTQDYVDATYSDIEGLRRTFERILALPQEKSDNAGRVKRIQAFAREHFGASRKPRLLDVGSGLGVFPYGVKHIGWDCTVLDPDSRAAQHIESVVGVPVVCEDFMRVDNLGRFDVITLNKVLEHTPDPVAMLSHTIQFLRPGGFVYVELPDGEMAAQRGAGREEFFIEHLHIFSFASIVMLANRAGFYPVIVERLQEPSTKYTLRAFCIPMEPPEYSSPHVGR